MEIELKLLVDPAHVDQLRSLPLLQAHAVEPPHRQELVSTYYDTPDLQVRCHDAALRLRKAGRGWLQALKGGGGVAAGLHQRNEWEGPVAGPALDLAALRKLVDRESAWGALLRDDALVGQLVPVFTTRVMRTVWDLRLPDGTEIECALDLGTLEHGERMEAVSELELELKSGAADSLFDFALQLVGQVPMRIGNVSKAERGYALYAPTPPRIVKAAPPALSRRMTLEQAFRAIAASCLAQIQGNETAVLDGSDAEGVHQMRIGLRRLRSLFKLFAKVLPVPSPLADEFGWCAGCLGAARDWQVLATSTLAVVERGHSEDAAQADEADGAGIDALRQAACAVADAHRQRAAEAIASVRYTRLMLGFGRWLLGGHWRDATTGQQRLLCDAPLKAFADRTLEKNQQRLRKRGRRLQGADPAGRHRLRIAAKTARYTAEFFASLYAGKRVRRYIGALSALQDELGWLNDAAVGDGLLRQLQEQRDEVATAAAFARGFLVSAAQHGDRQLHKAWKRFKPVRLPRK